MYWRLAGAVLLALAVVKVGGPLLPAWSQQKSATPREACLQGCGRTYHTGLAKCHERYFDCRRSWLGRRSRFYQNHVCVPKQALWLSRAYRGLHWCQLQCPMDGLH